MGTDEGEPEVMFDGLHHAREHLSGEMPLYILRLLTGNYGKDTAARRAGDPHRGQPADLDHPHGQPGRAPVRPGRRFVPRAGARTASPTAGSSAVGTDLNRNYDYAWSRGTSDPQLHQLPRASSRSRRPRPGPSVTSCSAAAVDGLQRIRAHISFHTAGEFVLWPYGYTHAACRRT